MGLTIAVDTMSGDHGPVELVPAVLAILKKHTDVHITLVGQEQQLLQLLKDNDAGINSQLSIKNAPKVIGMHESLSEALRNGKNSSMQVAIKLLKDGEVQACVSAGNTVALMAISKLTLKMLPGIERPAICRALPTIEGYTYMLDLGANVDSSATQLMQFAIMGSELAGAIQGTAAPTVALLNIGSEETKGNDCVKLASKLLSESDLNYVGFVEGWDIYQGKYNVIVCDGFTGNVALKASEGSVLLLKKIASEAIQNSLYGRLVGLVSRPLIADIKSKFDNRSYNGASLLGLRGIVVKGHGNSDRISFKYAIETAIIEARGNISEKLEINLEKLA